jgi:phosphoglucosamine mutase
MISASHNPFADNGIKLFAPGGLKLDDVVETRIEARYLELLDRLIEPVRPTGADVGSVADLTSGGLTGGPGPAGWIDALVASIEGDLRGLTVVLDCANGAAHTLAPEVFRRLGADVVVIGDQPDGVNINDGCGSTDPSALSKAVVEHGARAGLAFDGDADRLIAVDETGTVVDGDRVLAVLATDWKAQGRLRSETVVVTVMSNLGFHRAMAGAGIDVLSTAVGDRYVLQALDQHHLSLGGEQSGHVICRDLATTGDGVLTAVQLLDVVVRSGRTLSDLAGSVMVTVPQLLRNVRLPRRDDTLVGRLEERVKETEAAFGDDGRVLVRASGTEPLLRIMVEHVDPRIAETACDQLVIAARELVAEV